jgi:hypothetical protein
VTALVLASADRALDIPPSAFSALTWGDVTFDSTSGTQDVESSAAGWPMIPRGAGAVRFEAEVDLTPTGGFMLVVAVENPAGATGGIDLFSSWPWAVLSAELPDGIYAVANEIDVAPYLTSMPTDMDDGVLVLALVGNAAESFLASSTDGVMFIDAGAPAGTAVSAALPNASTGEVGLLGVWMWDGLVVSQADAVDTINAIAATFSAPPEAPDIDESTVGPQHTATMMRGLIGPARGPAVPSTIWGGWMDDAGQVLAWTGIEVDHDAFGPTANGVWNNTSVDAGYAPAGDLTRFGIFDAVTDGNLIIYAAIAFPEGGTPSEGDPVQFPPGALKFVVAPTVEPTPPVEE